MPDHIDFTEPLDIDIKLDCDALMNKIKAVLRRHLPTDDNGNPNPEFDDCFTAEQAIDEIYDIVGGI